MNAVGIKADGTGMQDSTSKDILAHWGESEASGQSVQFYTDDALLLEGFGRFIGSAIIAGDAAIVIATKAHRDGVAKQLKLRGLDLAPAIKQGRYCALDASDVLSQLMVDGWPNAARFSEIIGGIISGAEKSAQG